MTLDVDQFRPQIVRQIEQAVHKPVQLEKIKLGWQSGVALELQGFAVLKGGQDPEKIVEAQSAKAVLNLAPLLSRRIQIATVYLNAPVIRLVRKPDGTFEGLEPSSQKPELRQEKPAPVAGAEASLSFLVNKIRIQNGEFFYKDLSGKEPLEIHLRKITVEVDNVALDQPIDFNAQAAVFSPVQNLDLKGQVNVSSKDFSAVLNGFRAVLQVMPMDPEEIRKVSPAVTEAGILFPVEGTVEAEADSVKLNEQGFRDAAARIRFDRGRVRLASLKSPIENITADVLATPVAIQVNRMTAQISGGRAEGQASVKLVDPKNPEIVFGVKAEKLRVEELVDAPETTGPQLKGLLSLVVNGSLKGQTPEQIQQTVTADGTVTLEETVIARMNILREVFQKLSAIPGLVEKLLARLPAHYQEKLNARDTKLQTVRVPFMVRNGQVRLPELKAATDSFKVSGSATYGLSQGDVGGSAMLTIEPDLSAAMTRSVEELQYLMDSQKEVQIPLTVGGRVPKVTVMPDIQNIASRIAAQKAKDMIGGYMEKALGGKKTAEDPTKSPVPTTGGTKTSAKGVLGEILRRGIEGMSAES
jgi:uncharacterized protein involved in outer membrane biogenesis